MLHDLSCVVHLHSTHSDGTGTVPQIVAAARRDAVDVVLLTDHDTLAGRADEGWHGPVLLLVGEEISPLGHDHTLAFGLDRHVDHRGLSGAEIVAAVAEAGGLAFAAHPFSRGSERFRRFGEGMPHTGVGAPGLTGVELWSFVTDTAEQLTGLADVARFVATPERVVERPPQRNLEEWDRLCARRRLVAIGGIDAHQIGVRVGGRVPLRLMSYTRSFRYLRTHVLCEEPASGDLERDRAQVYDALREGRCYLAVDSLRDGRGFRFWAEGARGRLAMGGEAPAGVWRLHASLPAPADVTLVRDGHVVERARADGLAFDATGPGVFRIQAEIDGRTWIVSNPIYLR